MRRRRIAVVHRSSPTDPSADATSRLDFRLVDRGPDAGTPDPSAVRLVFADRDLSAEELAAAHR